MNPRDKLVRELLATGYIKSCLDYCQIAAFLECDCDRDQILAMTELKRWPIAYEWLQGRL
jgi:hypothetical protein